MSFWSRTPPVSVERLKARYEELGSLQAVADAEDLNLAWLGRALKNHDRRIAGSDADYRGPERRTPPASE